MTKLFLTAIIIFCVFNDAFSQCPCMGGASVGSLTPIGGTTNIGILKEGNVRATSFFSYSSGNEYYSGDISTDMGAVKNFNSSYLGIIVGYGLFDDFTIEGDLGYYVQKSQDFSTYILSGSGFSHATIYGKYNIFNSRTNQWEWTVGLGARMPVSLKSQNLPQNIQSSSGAYGGIILSFLHKGFKSDGLHLIIVNRAELNLENNNSYKNGSSFINSLFITKKIIDNFAGIMEIRNDFRLKDSQFGKKINDSGWNLLILSPQLNYSIKNFNISAFYDMPVYKYYNGTQLTISNTFGLSLTWQAEISNL